MVAINGFMDNYDYGMRGYGGMFFGSPGWAASYCLKKRRRTEKEKEI
ncbi:hypothetical protein [Methanosarcina sp. 2.H.A.1B.4]|nr:hypothetical protein [Methanosarcina sp. 2.H.A.1B.4]